MWILLTWKRKQTLVALVNTYEEDEYTHLVLGAPTVDITNMDKIKLKSNDNIEVFKQNVFISCENVFSATQNALSRHSKLKKVSMMEHATRFDRYEKDPTGWKPKLATFANTTFAQMLQNSSMKHGIMIGRHSLNCNGDQIQGWALLQIWWHPHEYQAGQVRLHQERGKHLEIQHFFYQPCFFFWFFIQSFSTQDQGNTKYTKYLQYSGWKLVRCCGKLTDCTAKYNTVDMT